MNRLLIAFFLLFPIQYAISQEKDPRTVFAESIFNSSNPLEVRLVSNYKNFRKDKFKDEYQSAWISFKTKSGEIYEDSIRIRARGNFRRKTCYSPPTRLNFKKSAFTPRDTSSYMDKIKLVSVCKSSKQYKEYIIKEFLVYKMYELLTDYSFRTRFFNLTTVDTHKGKMQETSNPAFIIEDISSVGMRNDAMEIEVKGVSEYSIDAQLATDMAVFQFMVGNTDWSVPGVHNIKLVKPNDHSIHTPIAIPYDFDYTGFVDADYAIPSEKLGIESVKQRVFRGVCRSNEEYERAFRNIKKIKPQILELIEQVDGLSDYTRKTSVKYINSFYSLIENEGMVRSYFIDGCKK
jgi:hypothetical protein